MRGTGAKAGLDIQAGTTPGHHTHPDASTQALTRHSGLANSAQRPQRPAFCANRAENSTMRDRFLPKSNSPKDERER